jgi:hypothetical protein
VCVSVHAWAGDGARALHPLCPELHPSPSDIFLTILSDVALQGDRKHLYVFETVILRKRL